jgi:phage repressor protein C with HTH and peptisase S24 domain
MREISRSARRSRKRAPKAAAAPRGEPDQETFITRLSFMVQKLGSVTALAQAAGVPESSVRSWLDGSDPSREKLVALADAAGVSIEWLSAGRGAIETDRKKVPTGYFAPRQLFRRTLLPPIVFAAGYLMDVGAGPTLFPGGVVLAPAVGDAMAPTIENDDILLIDTTRREKDDGVCVAIDQDGFLLVRRLQRRTKGGGFRLVCDNPRYPFTEAADVELVGRVVWVGGKLP